VFEGRIMKRTISVLLGNFSVGTVDTQLLARLN
jgi:hypothetical protein